MSAQKFSTVQPFVVLLTLAMFSGVSSSIESYYMDAFCGNTIYMDDSILLDLTAQTSYDSNMRCVVTIDTTSSFMNRLMIRVRWIDVEGPSYQCPYDRLLIYDGMDTDSYPLTGRGGICGTAVPYMVYRTNSEYATFNFTSDVSVERSGFELLITSFDHSGFCDFSEYECDNGDCVDKSLKCDSYKHCMEGSDEDSCGLSWSVITGISLGCVAGVIILVGLVILIASRRTRPISTRNARAVTERSSLVANGGPYTIQSQVPGVYMPPPPYASVYPTQTPGTAQGLPVTIQEVTKG